MMFGHVSGTRAWAKDYSSGLRECGPRAGLIAWSLEIGTGRKQTEGAPKNRRPAALAGLTRQPAERSAHITMGANALFFKQIIPIQRHEIRKKCAGIRYNAKLCSLLPSWIRDPACPIS
jgi:hypothetical protein